MAKFITKSVSETQEIAKKLAKKFQGGAIIALTGPLGAGKTTFAQGFAEGLEIKQRLLSPTFVLMREYEIPGNKSGKLFHIDLYRLENIQSMESLGLSEIFANPKNIILIEWAEKLEKKLPQETIYISFDRISDKTRKIQITQRE